MGAKAVIGILAIVVHYYDTDEIDWKPTLVYTVSYAQSITAVDNNRIGMVGYSLGGILTLKTASIDSRIKAIATDSSSESGLINI